MDRKQAECGKGEGGQVGDDTDCSELIQNLFLLLDGELADHTCADLEEHLRRCHGCLDRYGVERAFKDLIRRRCSHEPVPDVLIQRIRVTLRSQIL